ncbi:B12-binding domain-containing radical SAM protein [Candidatus Omnitrophota bacterium]
MEKQKLKILLVQLPAPEFNFKKGWGNLPLAAGYLKAMAYKEGLLDVVDIEIFGVKDTNLSSDSRLIDLIVAKSPDMLGFSLYVWNSMRSLFIAEEVKKKLPNVKTVVGGPEVTLDTGYILENPTVDIGCIGEGEFTFIEIIKRILNQQNDYADIKGIFYRKAGNLVVAPAAKFIKDLDQIPSPFALGFINPKDYPVMLYQGSRGCLLRCSYCVFGLIPKRYFSAYRICEDVKVFLKNGIRTVRFIDSDFLSHPDFHEICERIKKINHEKKLNFLGSIYSESINGKKIDLLKECNFTHFEIGVQSTNLKTLKNIQRPAIQGTEILAKLEILQEKGWEGTYGIDLMVGLPKDTLQDVRKARTFFKKNKVKMIYSFVVAILPGTRLAKDAKQYGIKYDHFPPYRIIEADYISRDDIQKARTLFHQKSKPEFLASLANYYRAPFSQKENAKNTSKPLDNCINKVILELDASCQSADQLAQAGKRLSRMICSPFTPWFKSQNIEKNLSLIEAFLAPIVNSNPFLLWNIMLEADTIFSLEIIERVKKNIHTKEKEICYSKVPVNMGAIFPWHNNKSAKTQLKAISKSIPFYWAFNISSEHDWQREISNLFQEKYSSGILVDFDPMLQVDFIANALEFLAKESATLSKHIKYRNIAFNYVNTKDNIINKPHHMESIVSIDKNMDITSTLLPSKEIAVDVIEYQIRLRKIFEKNRARAIPEEHVV